MSTIILLFRCVKVVLKVIEESFFLSAQSIMSYEKNVGNYSECVRSRMKVKEVLDVRVEEQKNYWRVRKREM